MTTISDNKQQYDLVIKGLKKWNHKRFPINAFMLIEGTTNSGKTTFANDLLFHLRNDIKAMSVHSGTEKSDPMFGKNKHCRVDKIPKCFTFPRLNTDALEMAKLRLEEVKSSPSPNMKNKMVLAWWDDVLTDVKRLKQEIVRDWIFGARHYGGGLIWLVQYKNLIPKELRKQPHFYAFQKPRSNQDTDETWKNMVSGYCPDLELWRRIVNFYTENYGTIVVDFFSKGTRLEDHIFWYKAQTPEEIGTFQIDRGGEMWKYAWFHQKDESISQMNWKQAPFNPRALERGQQVVVTKKTGRNKKKQEVNESSIELLKLDEEGFPIDG
jgi:hypothetical protein